SALCSSPRVTAPAAAGRTEATTASRTAGRMAATSHLGQDEQTDLYLDAPVRLVLHHMTLRDISALLLLAPSVAVADPLALVSEVAQRVAAERELPLLAPVDAALFTEGELHEH